jgi:S-adenosylmethionine hydrolase
MIVLLTDFGLGEYVGAMKGVILSINPDARIVDLCHDIHPQSIVEASWILLSSFGYFPRSTTFCCVVDPGVGTNRKVIAVRTPAYRFVAPDNGLLWETLKDQTIQTIRNIPIPSGASRTFHGRDVFARAAAQADLGDMERLGERIEQIERLDLYRNGREGTVVRIDHFGNVVTNLPPLDQRRYSVRIGDRTCSMSHCPTYADAPENEPFLITGSASTLEISLKNASANETLHVTPGQIIMIL